MNEHHNEATCSFDQLPNELVSNILETALRSSKPSDICLLFQRLRNVSARFRNCVDRFVDVLPRIYFPDGSHGTISVRRLINQRGPSSGLVLEVKAFINSNRWHNAWLVLYALGLGGFRIMKIFWRK